MIDFAKLATHSKPGPRYTSYPTANEFHNNFTYSTLLEALKRADRENLGLSLYTHLPFCKSACYFCGCNVIYTSVESKKTRYIEYLQKELKILKDSMDTGREVVQFHFGGGTPTFFSAEQLAQVIAMIRETFPNFSQDCEMSCEIDPRHFSVEQMMVLKEGGINRISFGVQDFDIAVQRSVNRIQPLELVKESMQIARDSGITSINLDLIYGLPKQSAKSFMNTLELVLSLNPDRLAIFNYAHVPWLKKSMRKINELELPKPDEKLLILKNTIEFLCANGYEMIGMDHFAKPSDELCRAYKSGNLRRNFQGYTTKGFSQTIGIGITSISEGVDYYSQNLKDMGEYERAIDSGILPVGLGYVLDSEDILRKDVIMSLMNNSKLDFDSISHKHHIDFKTHFQKELKTLEGMREFMDINDNGIVVNQTGSMLIRNIAMVFDTYLQKNVEGRFSKTI